MYRYNSLPVCISLTLLILLTSTPVSAQDDFIYWVGLTENPPGAEEAIFRAELGSSGIDTLVKGPNFLPASVAIDTLTNSIYWTDNGAENVGRIFRADLDGGNESVLVAGVNCGIGSLTDIELDLIHGHIYWAIYSDCLSKDLMRSDFTGTQLEDDLLTGPGTIEYPLYIALDPISKHIYWNGNRRANYDGSDIRVVAEGGMLGVALDLRAQKLYWSNGFGRIQRSNLDGTFIEDIVISDGDPTDLAIDVKRQHIYWTERTAGRIRRANLDGTGVEDLLTGLVNPDRLGLSFEHNVATSAPGPDDMPRTHGFHQTYPNPFRQRTTIGFHLGHPAHVTLTVHDVMGRTVAHLVSRRYPAGSFEVDWIPTGLADGIYFCSMQIDASVDAIPMLLQQ